MLSFANNVFHNGNKTNRDANMAIDWLIKLPILFGYFSFGRLYLQNTTIAINPSAIMNKIYCKKDNIIFISTTNQTEYTTHQPTHFS